MYNERKYPFVLTVAAQKGGVGKSTVACNLAICFASEGYNVELLDADTQNSSMVFRQLRSENDINDFVASANPTKTIHNDIDKKNGYDVVIIDSGGRDTGVMRSSILAATHGMLIIPFMASQFDLSALTDTLQILEQARTITEIEAYVLFNRVDERKLITQGAREYLGELQEDYSFNIFDSSLANRNDYITTIMTGKGVVEIGGQTNKAKKEMITLYSEIKKILGIRKGAKRK